MSDQRSPHDPNLIFGVLALQAGLITQAQFAEGCAAWTMRREVALGQVLQDRGWLKPGDREMIQRLADAQTKTHEGAAKSQPPPAAGPRPETKPGLFWTALLGLLVLNVLVLLGCVAWLWLQLGDAQEARLKSGTELVVALEELAVAKEASEANAMKAYTVERQLAQHHIDLGNKFLALREYDDAIEELEAARVLERDDAVPRLIDALLSRGHVLNGDRNYWAAAAYFGRVLELAPNNAEALLGRAKAYRRSNQAGLALADLDALIKLDDKNVAAYLVRARTHLNTRDNEAALKDANRAVELDKASLEALLLRAAVHVARGKDADAEADFQAALKLAPKEPESVYDEFAWTYLDAQQYDKAEPKLMRALELRKEKLGAEHPDVGNTLEALGDLHTERNDFDKAEPFYQEALKVRRKETHPKDKRLPELLDKLGYLEQNRNHLEEAVRRFTESLEARKRLLGDDHEELARSLRGLGAVMLQQDNLDGARKHYEDGLKLCKAKLGDEHVWTAALMSGLGEVLFAQGNAAAARDHHEQALAVYKKRLGEHHTDTATAADRLGTALQALGDAEGARKLHELAVRVLDEWPGPKDPKTLAAREHLGTALYTLAKTDADYEAAERQLRKAVDGLAEADASAAAMKRRLAHAAAVARTGQFAQAVVKAEAEAAKNPSAAALFDIGRVYAVCVAAVDRDKELPPADQAKLSATYTGEAVNFLGKAAGMGYFKTVARIERLKKDKDFDALRQNAEYKAFVERLINPE
jgi:Tfp pilus assembly protein PilF